jgi:hypothetical protein
VICVHLRDMVLGYKRNLKRGFCKITFLVIVIFLRMMTRHVHTLPNHLVIKCLLLCFLLYTVNSVLIGSPHVTNSFKQTIWKKL